jgi:hypothetical protein
MKDGTPALQGNTGFLDRDDAPTRLLDRCEYLTLCFGQVMNGTSFQRKHTWDPVPRGCAEVMRVIPLGGRSSGRIAASDFFEARFLRSVDSSAGILKGRLEMKGSFIV